MEITACTNLNTTYTAFYSNQGATDPCEAGSRSVTAEVAFDVSIQPRLVITKVDINEIECLDDSPDVQIFKIQNTGDGIANDIELKIGTGGTGATYFDGEVQWSNDNVGPWNNLTSSDVVTWGTDGNLYGTVSNTKEQTVTIPGELLPNGEIYIRVVQKHKSRNTASVPCEDLPSSVEFGNSWAEASYSHKNDCNTTPIQSGRTTLRDNLVYTFSGVNMGQVDIIPSQRYIGDFVLSQMVVDSEGLGTGAYLEIELELSSNLVNVGNVRLVDYTGAPIGGTVTPVGGVYKFKIDYNSADWPAYSAAEPRLDLRGARLQFEADLQCQAAPQPSTFYKVTTRLARGATCPPIESSCVQILLNNKCPDGECLNGGLSSGLSSLVRADFGFGETDGTTNGLPNTTPVDPASNPSVRATAFTTNDVLRISQRARSVAGLQMPTDGWKTGNMKVTIPTGLPMQAVPNSGQILISRGATTATVTGLLVEVDGSVATMTFDAAVFASTVAMTIPGFTGFMDEDQLVLSLDIRSTANANDGLKEFGVESTFTKDGVDYHCNTGGSFISAGYYARGNVSFTQSGNGNIVDCGDQSHKSVTLNYSLVNDQRNGLFPGEFKQVFFPKTAVFTVQPGLNLKQVRVVLRGQGTFGGSSETTVTPTGNVVDLEAALATIQGNPANGPHLDEGFEIQLIPIVESICTTEPDRQISVNVTYEGTVRDNSRGGANGVDVVNGSAATQTLNLVYHTGAGALQAVAVVSNTVISADKAEWVIQVTNNSTFREMKNVWLTKSSGGVNITSVQPVSDYAGTSPGTAVGGSESAGFELGDFATGQTRYYLITANAPTDCQNGSIVLNYGQSCDGTERCEFGSTPLTLDYTMGTPQIQAEIIQQPLSTDRPEVCADLPYVIELNNAGSGAAQNITLTIPLVSAQHLTYKNGSLQATAVYQGSYSPVTHPFDNPNIGDPQVAITGSAITITIPNTALGTGETLPAGSKITLSFTLQTNGCDFRSGQRIRFNTRATNVCNTYTTTYSATSNRITVQGVPDQLPVVTKTASASVVATTNPAGPLHATYNFEIANSNSNPYPLNGTGSSPHRFSIKLPDNWAFVTALADLFPDNVAEYVEDDAVRGHVFVLTNDVAPGSSIVLPATSSQLIYTPGTAIADLDCGTLGTITETVYGRFGSSAGTCPTATCDIEHVFMEGSTPLNMQTTPPTATGPQVFCAADNPTIGDLVATGDNLRFYRNATGGSPLALNTLLTDHYNFYANNSRTFYVTSSLVPDGACESARVPVSVYIPIANAGPDEQGNKRTSFTLAGNQPVTPVTGQWTIVSVSGNTFESEVVISNPALYNTTVSGIKPGTEVRLRWTLSNAGACETEDEVLLRSLIRPIKAEDDRFDNVSDLEVNGKTGTITPLPSLINNPHGGSDDLGGNIPTIGTGPNGVTIHPGTPNSNKLSMNPATGRISVEPNTPAGIYEFPYQICEIANPTNCDDAVAYIKVVASSIEAVEDKDGDFGEPDDPINGYTGGRTPSVLDNDLLNGDPLVPADVKLNSGTSPHPGLTMNPDGTITVSPGTPAGTYTYPYEICEVLNPDNCDNTVAIVIVGSAPIQANDDGLYEVNGSTGEPNVGNALTNDRLNGQPVTLDKITTTVVGTEKDGNPVGATDIVPELDTETGIISVPKGTLPGEYRIEYRICEVLNPTNCDNAYITVRVNRTPIQANDNTYGPVKGNEGNVNVGNILPNDIYDGRVPTLEDITISSTTTPPGPGDTPYPYIDIATGNVVVPPGTPDDDYTIPYTICEILNPANCSSANVTVRVAESTIDAIDDLYPSVSSIVGGTTTSVLNNDLLNGTILDPADITLTPGTSPLPGQIAMDPTTGVITINPGTPAGIYQYPYQICENLNNGNCDNAIATIVVTADPIVADNDEYGPFNGANTITTPGSVLDNDKLNGLAVAPADVTISIVHGATPIRTGEKVPVLDTTTGQVTVDAGTPEGVYHITYRICEVTNPTNCDDAIVTVVVTAPEIVANDNNYATTPAHDINGLTGGNISTSVVIDDTLNGVALQTTDINSTITLTPGTRPHPGISMDGNGIISVAPNTPAGEYEYPYTICEILNPTNCDHAVATIRVVAPTIVANDDNLGAVNGLMGGTTSINVLTNDELGGTPIPSLTNPESVILTPLVSSDPRITMNGNGTITVAPGTPAGSYTHTYRICEILNPNNCDVAIATVTVDPADIVANVDNFGASNGATGNPNVGNALTNDLLNGVLATLDKVRIQDIVPATPINGGAVPALDPETGIVSVPPGTPEGNYVIGYTICELLNTTNCSTNTIHVSVGYEDIIARPDHYGPVTTAAGHPNLGNILVNDELNGVLADLSKVTLTVTPATPKFPGASVPEVDATGQVSVPTGTPAGTYVIPYRICETLNPINCANTTATVIVSATPIIAVNDRYGPVAGLVGRDLGNALDNDSFNGKDALEALNNNSITIENIIPAAEQPTAPAAYRANVPVLDAQTGVVSIPNMTPAGTYTIGYSICEVADPTNCDQATITVEVVPALIDPDEDFFKNIDGITGTGGPTSRSVLDNDKLNNVLVNPSEVTITEIEAATPLPGAVNAIVPVLNMNDGSITVLPGTPAGEYEIRYNLCENLNPTNCDWSTAYINVVLPQIEATNDTYGPVNSVTGNDNVGNVLDNDWLELNTIAATTANVEITQLQGATPVQGAPTGSPLPLLNTATGVVSVPANTPAGQYLIHYRICDRINVKNCDDAMVVINVFKPEIKAVDDNYTSPVGMVGSPDLGNVLDNDIFNGAPADISDVDIKVLVPAVPNHNAVNTNVPEINVATGVVSVPVGTPAGTYQIRYRICDKLNPTTNCDEAVVTVVVPASVIDANDDFTPEAHINGYNGGTTASVLDNDRLNNLAIDPSDITLTPDMDGPYPGKLTFNTDGTITVAPQTEAGTYRWWYTICENLNPGNCDRAVATIIVEAAPIDAVDDNFALTIERFGSKTPSVLDNDRLNGDPIIRDEIKLTPGIPSHPGLTMNDDGTINIPAGIKEGTYTYPYEICEVLNSANCDEAVATIVIKAPDLYIPNTFTPNGDGKNDRFEIIGWEAYDRIELVVFNRWGNEVYRNVDYDNSWTGDGLNNGTYYYMVKLIKGNTTDTRKGWVLIKRN